MRLVSLQDWVEKNRPEGKPWPKEPEFHDETSFGDSPLWTRILGLIVLGGTALTVCYIFAAASINMLK